MVLGRKITICLLVNHIEVTLKAKEINLLRQKNQDRIEDKNQDMLPLLCCKWLKIVDVSTVVFLDEKHLSINNLFFYHRLVFSNASNAFISKKVGLLR